MDQRQQFEQLALPFLPLLRRSAVQLTRDSQIAGDLIQDTYLKAWRCFDQFTPGTNCKAWLFSIMYSLFIYALVGGSQQIVGFRIQPNGGLIPLAAVDFIPEGANGLAAR